MENYSKARTVEQPSVCPFSGLGPDTPEIRVKDGSKLRNLLRYALSRMEAKGQAGEEEADPQGPPLCPQLVFTAVGKAVSKAITCAEIVKRRVKGLHQLTRLLYGAVVEVWEPREPGVGLDSLTVNRNVPTIWILLSRDPLDGSQSGYQAPGRYDALWAQSASRQEGGPRAGPRKKRGGGGGRGRGPGRQTGRARESETGQN